MNDVRENHLNQDERSEHHEKEKPDQEYLPHLAFHIPSRRFNLRRRLIMAGHPDLRQPTGKSRE
jgi:hypothetical protein